METRRGNRNRRATTRVRAGVLLALAATGLFFGCQAEQGPSPPGNGGGSSLFSPAGDLIAIPCNGYQDFEAGIAATSVDSIVWSAVGGQSGHGPRFRYFADGWQADTVRVTVHGDGYTRRHSWRIDPAAGLAATGFLPRAETVQLVWGLPGTFAVRLDCRPSSVQWYLDDANAGRGAEFTYVPEIVGPHHLTAAVSLTDSVLERSWDLQVVAPDTHLVFRPPASALSIHETLRQHFVVDSELPLAKVAWRVDGLPAATGHRYVFAAATHGSYRVDVTVTLPDTSISHGWQVEVIAPIDGRPGAVRDLDVRAGPWVSQTTITFSAVVPDAFPVTDYELRYATFGPITDTNWPAATPLGPDQWLPIGDEYRLVVNNEDLGWATDTELHFAVRAVDSRGVASVILASPSLVIDNREWWLEGVCVGPDGNAAAGAVVRELDGEREAICDATGAYRLGPLRNRDAVVAEAGGVDPANNVPWSILRSDVMLVTGTRRHDFMLIPAYPMDRSCPSFEGEFLHYLKHMTLTHNPLISRPDYRLCKWEEYPVAVYVPTELGEAQPWYPAACREAVAIWNDNMGREYLRLVDEPPAVGITIAYEGLDHTFASSALLQPGDGVLHLGEVDPLQVTIFLRPEFPHEQSIIETTAHELGHCLGLYNHTYCNDTPYLMDVTAGGALDRGRDQVVHPDERHAVHVIRQLPQGQDMSVFVRY